MITFVRTAAQVRDAAFQRLAEVNQERKRVVSELTSCDDKEVAIGAASFIEHPHRYSKCAQAHNLIADISTLDLHADLLTMIHDEISEHGSPERPLTLNIRQFKSLFRKYDVYTELNLTSYWSTVGTRPAVYGVRLAKKLRDGIQGAMPVATAET